LNTFQAVRMGLSWARVYAYFGAWTLREHPDRCAAHLPVDDITVYYKDYGKGEPVLLLHGGFGYLEHWCAQIQELSKSYHVIAMDSRGHGRTTLGDKPMTYRGMAGDVSSFIEKLGCGPVHLIGWSDGGCISLALALQRPDLVRSIVLVGTPFHTDNYSPAARELIQTFLNPHSPSLISLMLMRRLMTAEPARGGEFLERISRMWLELPDFSLEELGRISAPTLVIACDKDEYLSDWPNPLQVFEATTEAIHTAQMTVVPGGTHGVLMSRAPVVNEHILAFLGDHGSRPT